LSDLVPILSAALLTGLLGSAHCLGMCAGISGLFGVSAEIRTLRRQLPMAIAYNAGRILTYALLGIIVATVGSALVAAKPTLARPTLLITGTVIILIGLQVAFNWRLLNPLERMGAVLWQKLSPVARFFVPVTSIPKALGLGLLWGWLPCGLVYSVLLIAATSAQPFHGGATMIAFGIGTMPAMILTGIGAAQLSGAMRRRGARLGLGLLIVALGVLTIMMPVSRWLAAGQHQLHAM
jgi:sulfite exporter TauE/SafE